MALVKYPLTWCRVYSANGHNTLGAGILVWPSKQAMVDHRILLCFMDYNLQNSGAHDRP